jgi:hypothetical protein
MAKMFYTIDEVARKLGKSEDQVREMARTGQIQEFRDRDKVMFKVDQIDLLAGGEDDAGEVHLELTETSGGSGVELGGSGLGLSGSGLDIRDESAIGLADSREGTGVSVFDTDHGGEASDAGRAAEGEEELSLEAVGSGSGLLDLTRESDDTSLGAELLEEVYSGDENIDIPANASGLFEAAGAESPGNVVAATGAVAAMPVLVEAYDGSGSGLATGLMLGALAALVCIAIVLAVTIMGGTSQLAVMLTSSSNNLYMWSGGLLGLTIICGLVGLFIGKASE